MSDLENVVIELTKNDSKTELDLNDNFNDSRNNESNYCNKCGFDLNPNWNSCPNCGQRIVQRSNRNNNDYFY